MAAIRESCFQKIMAILDDYDMKNHFQYAHKNVRLVVTEKEDETKHDEAAELVDQVEIEAVKLQVLLKMNESQEKLLAKVSKFTDTLENRMEELRNLILSQARGPSVEGNVSPRNIFTNAQSVAGETPISCDSAATLISCTDSASILSDSRVFDNDETKKSQGEVKIPEDRTPQFVEEQEMIQVTSNSKIIHSFSSPSLLNASKLSGSRASFNFDSIESRRVYLPPKPPDIIAVPRLSRNLSRSHYLTNFYSKCGYYTYASQMLDVMPERDNFSWALMITCYTRKGKLEKARELLELVPDKLDTACWNAMIAGYAKKGQFNDAEKVFEKMPVKDLVSYNSMLAGYTQNGKTNSALLFFERMAKKNAVSWNLMVAGFVNSGDLNSAWQLFVKIPNPNAVSWVTMLCGFARHGKINEARRLFDKMLCKNVVSWNAMIAAYVQDLQIDEAVKLFIEMPPKDCVSWTTMINGYIRVGKLDEAHEVYNQMPRKDLAAETALMSGLVQNGRIDEASQIFSQLGKRDAICWNSMIAGYCQSGRMSEAANLFRQMPIKNAVSWNTMISGYAQAGEMDRAAEIFQAMGERNIVFWNSLIAGFLQNSLYLDALKSFVLMGQEEKKPDQSTFACALSACANLAALQVGYALNGHANEAFKAFERMLSEGMVPDEVTFIGMLSACSHGGLADQGNSCCWLVVNQDMIANLTFASMVSQLTPETNLIFATAHSFPIGSLLFSQLIQMVAVLHRKMICRGNVRATNVLIKWKDLPPKHGTWKYSSLRTRMFEGAGIVTVNKY